MSDNSVFVSTKSKYKLSKNNKKKVGLVLIVLILLLLAGWLIFVKDQKNNNKEVLAPLSERQATLEKEKPGVIKETKQGIDSQLQNTDSLSSEEEKAGNLVFVAYDYQAISDYENAIKTYEKILTYDIPEYQKWLYTVIGDLYIKLGDNTKAVDSYAKSKEQITKLSSGDEQKELLASLDKKLQELKK